MIVLLANIGNSDLRVDKALLPDGIVDEKGKIKSRQLGEEVQSNFEKYRESITLPLIEPTLQWIAEQEQCDLKDIHLVLFTSDQNPDVTKEFNWLQDTKPIAEVIQIFLNFKYQMSKKHVRIRSVEGSPADYINALAFHQQEFQCLGRQYGNDDNQIYMEISGGTPAMTAMLLLMGVETFGLNVVTLYMDRHSDQPYEVGIAEALHARKTRENLRTQVDLYAYAIAKRTMEEYGNLIISDRDDRALIIALLGYADRRLAFDYDRARAELRGVRATGDIQAQVRYWQRELSEDDASRNIAELIHGAEIKIRQGEYADLTQRLFRFQESIFRYMAEQMGLQYSSSGSNEYLSQTWRESQKELHDFLNSYKRDAKGRIREKEEINIGTKGRSLNRLSLGAIVDYYVTETEQWQHWRETTDMIFELSVVADLRNKGIAGHGFEGIGREDIESAFGHPIDDLIERLHTIYKAVFNTDTGHNPYARINDLIKQLIEARA